MKYLVSVSIVLAAVVAHADDSKVDLLIEGMKTADEAALVRARQMLPFQDPVAASRELVKLISHPEERVWRTAYNLLADFANMSGAPGHEAQRQEIAGLIMALVGAERSQLEKEQGLRLLPQAAPDNFDLSPVAALLSGADAHLAERARAALAEINTQGAADTAAAALPGASPSFQVALLDALSAMDHPNLGVVEGYLQSPEPLVRIAAARVIAKTGEYKYLEAMRGVQASATPETAEDATRCLVIFAGTMARSGGKYEVVIPLFRDLARNAPTTVIRGAALVSLGRYGNASVIPEVMEIAAASPNLELAGPAVRALEYQQGRSGREGTIQAYAAAPAELKPLLLALCGRKQDAGFVELLAGEAASADAVTRQAAQAALATSARPEAVQPLVTSLDGTPDAEKPAAVAQLRQLANAMRAQNAPQAGQAYVALYRLAASDDDRSAAMQGIKQFPVPEAYEIVAGAGGKEQIATWPPAALAGIARSLKEAGKAEESKQVFDMLFARLDSAAAVQEVMRLAPEMGFAEGLTQRLGFLMNWHIAAPFPWKMAEGFDVTGVNAAGPDLAAPLTLASATAPWKEVRSQDGGGMINLAEIFGMVDSSRAYAFTVVEAAEATEAALRMGSDDGIAAWVNGEKVHENNVDRGLSVDADIAPVKLKQGANAILLEITQGGGGWNFCARLTKADGSPL